MGKFVNQGDKDTRSGFGVGLLELGRSNKNILDIHLIDHFVFLKKLLIKN